MKKVLLGLGFCLYLATNFTSCGKPGCYTCKNVVYEVNICDNNVTGTGVLNEAAASSIKLGASASTNESYKASAESQGYTCTAQ